jgi:hypothetical protein
VSERRLCAFVAALLKLNANPCIQKATPEPLVIRRARQGRRVTDPKESKMNLGQLTGLIAVILIFSMPVTIIAVLRIMRSRDNAELQKTLRLSIEKGQPLPPEFLESLHRVPVKVKSPANDVRGGAILIAIALGILVWNFVVSGFVLTDWAGFAAIPGFIGIVLLVLGMTASRK